MPPPKKGVIVPPVIRQRAANTHTTHQQTNLIKRPINNGSGPRQLHADNPFVPRVYQPARVALRLDVPTGYCSPAIFYPSRRKAPAHHIQNATATDYSAVGGHNSGFNRHTVSFGTEWADVWGVKVYQIKIGAPVLYVGIIVATKSDTAALHAFPSDRDDPGRKRNSSRSHGGWSGWREESFY